VMAEPRLAGLFGPGSRGEVAIAGRVGPPGGERAVAGQIDRMAVTPSEVLLADFKTGAPPPGGVPGAYLAQLALYRELLAAIHPDRPVRTLLVWTEGPTVIEPDPAALGSALAQVLGRLP
ncbi:PD-(D/E)XK nuclease family protein, partial [Enterovirga sp.]|uniref:PD-(D/E)XK nuclease family protein n=1 Tax=Enterovirga sp. TaxID=2026350 RepID=UPI00260A27F3